MTILITLGPLLFSLLLGYWLNIKYLSDKVINSSLSWLTYLILGMVGASIGALDGLAEKLVTAGAQAFVFFGLFSVFSIAALCLSGHYFRSKKESFSPKKQDSLSLSIFSDALKTLVAVVIGVVIGIFYHDSLGHLDSVVTYLLYLLLLLIGCQLQRANYRLRKLFLNIQANQR